MADAAGLDLTHAVALLHVAELGVVMFLLRRTGRVVGDAAVDADAIERA